ncbi:MAG: response regulator [Deltaproteobacteria bacterium]|nr:response regulator [Deltaproteobacteria bacterium]
MGMVTKHKILVVDDYPDAAESACAWFVMHGHECRIAYSVREALAQLATFHPDIALVDIGLPDRSGLELARELRVRFGRSIYVAAMTGWAEVDIGHRAITSGCDQYMIKPATGNKLHFMLSEASRTAMRDVELTHVA